MIINYLDKIGPKRYRVVYINLETRKKYTLSDEGEEQHLPMSELDLQMRLAASLYQFNDMLEEAMHVYPMTEKDQLEIKRLDNKVKYILNYEYNNTK